MTHVVETNTSHLGQSRSVSRRGWDSSPRETLGRVTELRVPTGHDRRRFPPWRGVSDIPVGWRVLFTNDERRLEPNGRRGGRRAKGIESKLRNPDVLTENQITGVGVRSEGRRCCFLEVRTGMEPEGHHWEYSPLVRVGRDVGGTTDS